VFFIDALPYASSNIHYVSEGDLCRKTQNFMFARRMEADIFKCDKPTMHGNKQTADT
jgi:hypothetical protein